MNPSLIIRIAANKDDLIKNLRESKDQIEVVTAGFTKLASSLTGDRLIQQAHNIVAAVHEIGGATKLTEAEKQRLNATLTKAIEKYAVLGKEAPASMRALQKETTTNVSALDKVIQKLGPVGTAMAGAFTVGAVVGATTKVLNLADQLENLSAKTGISTTGLQKFTLAFQGSGVSIDTVTANVTKLAANLVGGDKAAVGALEKLGLKIADLKAMAPEDQFTKVADAIGGIANPSEKAYAAMKIFGKGGAEILQGLDGHLAETTKKFESMGLIIDEKTVKAADDFGDQMGLMGTQLTAILAGVLGPMLPALSALGEVLMWVANIAGKVVGTAIKGLTIIFMALWAGIAEGLSWLAELATRIPIVGKHLGGFREASDWLHASAVKTTAQMTALALGTTETAEAAKKATGSIIGLGAANADAEAKARKHAEALEHIAEAMAGTEESATGLTATCEEQVRALLKMKISEGDIAAALDISEAAIKRVIAADQSRIKYAEDLNKIHVRSVAALEGVIAAQQRLADQTNKQILSLVGVWKDYGDKLTDQSLRGTDLRVAHLQREHATAVANLGVRTEATAAFYDKARALVDDYYSHEEERAAHLVGALREDYEILKQSNTATVAEIRAAWDQWWEANYAETHADLIEWDKGLEAIAGSFQQLAQIAGGTFGGIVQNIGTLIASAKTLREGFKNAGKALDDMKDNGASMGSVLKLAGAVGEAIGGAIQLGKAIAGIFGFGKPSDREKVINEIKQMGDQFTELSAKAASFGISMDSVTKARNLTTFHEQLKQVQADISRIDGAMSRLNATWADFEGEQRMERFDELVRQVNLDVSALERVGITHETALRRASAAYVKLGIDAVNALGQIPESLAPVLLELAKMGAIAEEDAKKLLGLKDENVLDFQAMEEAASRYGIAVESLGTQYQAAKLGDVGKNLLKDWTLLITNGADAGAVIDGMGQQVRDFVKQSLTFGLDVPANMQPMLEKFLESGQLVDANGQKLTDLSSINFVEPIATSIDRLIAKLGELVTAIGSVGGAFGAIQPPNVSIPDTSGTGINTYHNGGEVRRAHNGWMVIDGGLMAGEVPIIAKTGEQVLPSGEAAEYRRNGGSGGGASSSLETRLDSLERTLRDLPRANGRAVSDAMTLAKRRA